MRKDGFTLLEVVLTMVILALVMLTAWGAFDVGFTTRNKGEARAEKVEQIRVATEVMGRQLKSAVYYFARYEEDFYPFFVGAPTELSFVTAYPQGKAGNGLAWVTYRVEEDRLVMIERVGFRPDDLYGGGESENQGLSAVLLKGFTRFSFSYAPREEEGEEWEKAWDGREEESLPAIVRLRAEGLDFFGQGEWTAEVPLLTMASGWGMDEFEEPPEVPEGQDSLSAGSHQSDQGLDDE